MTRHETQMWLLIANLVLAGLQLTWNIVPLNMVLVGWFGRAAWETGRR